MSDQQLASVQNLISQNPSLIWYTKSYSKLPVESVAEAIFNYGTWQEFIKLKDILGLQNLAKIFAKLDSMSRNNLFTNLPKLFSSLFPTLCIRIFFFNPIRDAPIN